MCFQDQTNGKGANKDVEGKALSPAATAVVAARAAESQATHAATAAMAAATAAAEADAAAEDAAAEAEEAAIEAERAAEEAAVAKAAKQKEADNAARVVEETRLKVAKQVKKDGTLGVASVVASDFLVARKTPTCM